jgi:hypothetical protein
VVPRQFYDSREQRDSRRFTRPLRLAWRDSPHHCVAGRWGGFSERTFERIDRLSIDRLILSGEWALQARQLAGGLVELGIMRLENAMRNWLQGSSTETVANRPGEQSVANIKKPPPFIDPLS